MTPTSCQVSSRRRVGFRIAGFTSWLLVGVVVLVAGVIWLATLTEVIVIPVVVAGVIAAVAGQLVAWLKRRGLPRGLGALLVLLLIVGAGVTRRVPGPTGNRHRDLGDQRRVARRRRPDRGLVSGPRGQRQQGPGREPRPQLWRQQLIQRADSVVSSAGSRELASLAFFFGDDDPQSFLHAQGRTR